MFFLLRADLKPISAAAASSEAIVGRTCEGRRPAGVPKGLPASHLTEVMPVLLNRAEDFKGSKADEWNGDISSL